MAHVPGGFGVRGIEGKIIAARFAREQKVPYLGLCLGMQTMCIEYARNVLQIEDANSSEFESASEHNVIDLMLDQKDVKEMGGTMRLGQYACHLTEGSTAWKAYNKQPVVTERHRHRFEFNNAFRNQFEEGGMNFSGLSPNGTLVEIAEVNDHPYMLGSQFHPEFAVVRTTHTSCLLGWSAQRLTIIKRTRPLVPPKKDRYNVARNLYPCDA